MKNRMLLQNVTEVGRAFDYDYIYVDAIWLAIWLGIVIVRKKWIPLKAGAVCAVLVYFIDAVIWWNTSYGDVYIREYWIGGVWMPHPLGNYTLLKFGADFMMTISYSLFAFTWLFIMYESWKEKHFIDMAIFTAILSAAWLSTPFISEAVHWNDTLVQCVRHMNSQLVAQVLTVIIGYLLLVIVYGTSRLNRKNIATIVFVFCVGCYQGFIMEFPLLISGIRPSGVDMLIYETFFLANQGAPFLYLFWEIVLPFAQLKWKKRMLHQPQ